MAQMRDFRVLKNSGRGTCRRMLMALLIVGLSGCETVTSPAPQPVSVSDRLMVRTLQMPALESRIFRVVELEEEPDADTLAVFGQLDVRIITRQGPNTYLVSAENIDVLNDPDLRILTSREIKSEAKTHVSLSDDSIEVGGWADLGNGRYRILVRVFRDFPSKEIRKALETLLPYSRITQYAYDSWLVDAGDDQIDDLAKRAWVRSIEPAPATPRSNSSVTDPVHNASNSVTAKALLFPENDDIDANPADIDCSAHDVICVGIADFFIDDKHDDFRHVVTAGGTKSLSVSGTRFKRPWHITGDHGTHVASILGGNGYLSGGAFTSYRPLVRFGEYAPMKGNMYGYCQALVEQEMDLVNHSYEMTWDSTYNSVAQIVDEVIRGDGLCDVGMTSSLSVQPLPAAPHIWSAGNLYGMAIDVSNVTAPAKNAIVVGSVDVDFCLQGSPSCSVSEFVSLGPTKDGRIKPDIVAPGCMDSVKGNGICAAFSSPTDKECHCGSSQAAPVVSGAIGMLMSAFDDPSDAFKYPATYRAVLVHAAQDLSKTGVKNDLSAYDGPDPYHGWGLLDSQAAVVLAQDKKRWRESGKVGFSEDSDEYCMNLANMDDVKVTLAWDDLPGKVCLGRGCTGAEPNIVHDLDLELVSPGDKVWHPWTFDIADNAATIPSPKSIAVTRKPDRRNNVEVVHVSNAEAGFWRIRVSANATALGIQPYSLAASHEIIDSCATLTVPKPEFDVYPEQDYPVAIGEICDDTSCDCEALGYESCPASTLTLEGVAQGEHVFLYDERGALVATDTGSAAVRTLPLPERRPGDRFFVVTRSQEPRPRSRELRAVLRRTP